MRVLLINPDFVGHGLSRLFAPRPAKSAGTLRESWGAPLPGETALCRERVIVLIAFTETPTS